MMVQGTFSELLAPGLRKVFHTAYNEQPELWPMLFNRNSSTRAYEEDYSWAGFEPLQEFDELEHIQLRDARPGFKTRYVHRTFGLGYQLSRQAVDDNLYGNTKEFPAHLARSARATKEITAATIFNLGFDSTRIGGDGQALFSTAHPLAGAGGGTQSNTFTTARALSYTALKDAITIMKRNKADDNLFAPIRPAILLVPDTLEFTAKEILGSDKMPYSGDNTKNVLTDSNLKIVSWSYLTSDVNWFLLAPVGQTMLNYFERWPLRQFMKDREEYLAMLHLLYYRDSFGWSDFRGTFGALG